MAIKGAILGDILGSPYEFKRVRDYDWKTVPLTWNPSAGFTDDTVMTLAIKKAIIEGLDLTETMVEVGRRYPNCGYGGSFRNWVNGNDHTPYGSYGNGSAMRVSFVGEYFDDFDKM
ncbi:MAG: ADP-ribosylglycohydrolase family protein, partial [Oribacterium sp.]|nr:ADP-ribosylglycohydrolase family protein [Oribacterium sp.]